MKKKYELMTEWYSKDLNPDQLEKINSYRKRILRATTFEEIEKLLLEIKGNNEEQSEYDKYVGTGEAESSHKKSLIKLIEKSKPWVQNWNFQRLLTEISIAVVDTYPQLIVDKATRYQNGTFKDEDGYPNELISAEQLEEIIKIAREKEKEIKEKRK